MAIQFLMLWAQPAGSMLLGAGWPAAKPFYRGLKTSPGAARGVPGRPAFLAFGVRGLAAGAAVCERAVRGRVHHRTMARFIGGTRKLTNTTWSGRDPAVDPYSWAFLRYPGSGHRRRCRGAPARAAGSPPVTRCRAGARRGLPPRCATSSGSPSAEPAAQTTRAGATLAGCLS